eukprot:6102956-Pyramimonas_sp.AAC.1
MTRAGLAWDLVEDFIEHIQEGSGARTFGHCEDSGNVCLTELARQKPEIFQALRHLAHRCFELLNVRDIRLIRGQKQAGAWPGCSRSLVIWWFPKDPYDTQQMHLNSVHFD